jgi:hypothetical protein
VSLIRPERREKATLVMAGGLGVSAIPYGAYEGAHTLLGALPVLIHPAPRRIAVIGMGSGDTSWAAGARPETDGSSRSRSSAPSSTCSAPARRGATFRCSGCSPSCASGSGRGRTRFLRRDPGRFDVIEVDALRPAAPAGNLYSLEYFSCCASARTRRARGHLAADAARPRHLPARVSPCSC